MSKKLDEFRVSICVDNKKPINEKPCEYPWLCSLFQVFFKHEFYKCSPCRARRMLNKEIK